MNKCDVLIPIGYICSLPLYIAEINRRDKKYVFDHAYTPMWSVCDLVENDFEDFMSKDNIDSQQITSNFERKFWFDSKYGYIPEQDLNINKLKLKLTEYVTNFREELNSNKTILFIRMEECYRDDNEHHNWGVKMENYPEKTKFNELYYVKKFSNIIKSHYPQLKFAILFLNTCSKKEKYVDAKNNIIGIKSPCWKDCDWRDKDSGKKLKNYLAKYIPYINRALRNTLKLI